MALGNFTPLVEREENAALTQKLQRRGPCMELLVFYASIKTCKTGKLLMFSFTM